MKKIVKLRQQGNSLMITIPKDLIADLKWKEEDYMMLTSENANQNESSHFRSQKILKVEKVEE